MSRTADPSDPSRIKPILRTEIPDRNVTPQNVSSASNPVRQSVVSFSLTGKEILVDGQNAVGIDPHHDFPEEPPLHVQGHRPTESMDTNLTDLSCLTGITEDTALPGPGRVRAPTSKMNSLDFEKVVNAYSIRTTRSRLFTKKEVTERAAKLDLAWSMTPDEATDISKLLKEKPNGSEGYDTFENLESDIGEPLKKRRTKFVMGHSGRSLTRWLFICLTGFFTGMITIFIVWCTEILCEIRLDRLDESLRESVEAANAEAEAMTDTAEVYRSIVAKSYFWIFLRYAAYNLALALSSSAMCLWLAPGAVGSGIPEMIAYLNGIRVKRFADFKLFNVKIIGTILSVSSGLAIGPEGPLVHIGAVVGASLAKSAHLLEKIIWFFRRRCPSAGRMMGCAKVKRRYKDELEEEENAKSGTWDNSALSNLAYHMKYFSNDVERRDLISIGAACGFAAAFGAPIGGVLFSLEEASSFFAQQLLWKTLVATAIATFGIAIFNGSLAQFGVISLDTNNVGSENEASNFLMIPLYILIGIQGGLLGALFNGTWERMMKTRMWFFGRKPMTNLEQNMWKLLTLSFLSILTSTLCYILPLGLHWSCRELDDDEDDRRRFNCASGQYNELASILFGSRDEAIKRILTNPSEFDPRTLVTVFLLFYPLYLMTFGESVPSGIFMPTVLTGSALGAWTGIFFQHYIDSDIEPATFGVLGAAALLSGVQRNVVSLCVILVEGTGQVKILIPVIVTIVTARYVGDLFNEGVYHMGMHLKHYPFLEHRVKKVFDIVRCSDIMSCPARVVKSCEKAGDIEHLLLHSNHHAFPVVETKTKKFLGLVRRDQLIALLELGIFMDDFGEKPDSPATFRRVRGLHKKQALSDWEDSAVPPPLEKARRHHSTFTDFRRDNVLGSLLSDSEDGEDVYLNDKIIVSKDRKMIALDGDDALPVCRVKRRNIATTDADGKLIVHLSPEDRSERVDVAAVMNRGAYCVTESCPLTKAYTLFTALGLRHLVVLGGPNGGNVVGIVTRSNLDTKFIEERTAIDVDDAHRLSFYRYRD